MVTSQGGVLPGRAPGPWGVARLWDCTVGPCRGLSVLPSFLRASPLPFCPAIVLAWEDGTCGEA